VASKPIVQDLSTFGTEIRPLSTNLSSLLTSLRDTGGIERLMDFLFYQVAAINGFDSYGHYLRAQLIVNTCTTYRVQNDPSCTANFVKGSSARAASSRDDSIRSPRLVRQDRVANGESVDAVLGRNGASDDKSSSTKRGTTGAIALPPALLPGGTADSGGGPSAPATTQSAPSQQTTSQDPAGALLDYLLGGAG
jgi:phospholipid/cholesterol/gamma-HCH transport system substrate-binding protein